MKKKKMSVQKKVFLSILLVSVTVTTVFGAVSMVVFRNRQNESTQELAQELLEQVSENMENNTQNLLDMSFEFMSKSEFQKLLLMNRQEIYTEMGIRNYRSQVRTLGSRFFSTSSPVYAFYVRDKENVSSWWIRYSKNFNYSKIDSKFVSDILNRAENRMDREGSSTCWFVNESDGRIYLARKMIRTSGKLGDHYATIVFAIDESFFTPVQANQMLIENEDLYFQNRNNGTVVTNSEDLAKKESYVDEDYKAYGRKITKDDDDTGKYMLIKYANRNAVWNLYCLIPEDRYIGSVYSVFYFLLGFLILAILSSLLISYLVSNGMTRSIRDLKEKTSRVGKGDFTVHIVPSSNDEIGELCHSFNHMSDRIEELVEQAYREGKEKEKLKMTVLKAQVNPHFLYNSLGSIKCMAKMEGQDGIAQMTTALIDLLRASLGKTSEFQTVEQEVDYVRNYFLLQLFRYEDAFRVEYDIAEETKQLITLNFLLQPLAENALFHGIEISKGNGVIRVSSHLEDGKLILSVTDNGLGMTMEQIEGLFAEKEKKYEGLNSIGVQNVHQRIQRYFGTQYGLSYTSSPGEGCRVDVVLPVFSNMEEVKTNV